MGSRCSVGVLAAQEIAVPLRLQVDLLSRVISYDRNLAARVGGELRVLVVVKRGDGDSERNGAQIMSELQARTSIAQYRLRAELVVFEDPKALAELCRSRHAAIAYLSTGLSANIPEIARAFSGVDVLSVAALDDDVKRGVVLGFAVSSGKPKLLVHLGQAHQQHVDFRADFLRIAQVVSK